jgi:hypothetical protein
VHFDHLVAVTLVYSKSEVVKALVLSVLSAVFGYVASERYKRVRGVTPWKVPSGAWAVILFVFTIFGLVVYLVAWLSTKARSESPEWHAGEPRPGYEPQNFQVRPPEGWNGPAPGPWSPKAAQGWAPPPVVSGAPAAGEPQAPPPLLPPVAVPAPPPRSWLTDPSGRHELRYWDGTKFTEHVADAGKISVDPL